MSQPPTAYHEKSHSHVTADFLGVPPEQLRDATLLGGPVILENGHLAIHSLPSHQALLLDVVAPASHDFRKAMEVFSRRLTAKDIKTDTRGRG